MYPVLMDWCVTLESVLFNWLKQRVNVCLFLEGVMCVVYSGRVKTTDETIVAVSLFRLQPFVVQSAIASSQTGVIVVGTLLSLINVVVKGFSLCFKYFQTQV